MRRGLIPILTLLILGCGAIRMYPGPELTRDKIAILEIGNVTLYTLDGEALSLTNKRKLQILPGEHVLRASHHMAGYGEQPIVYTFTAEPGHHYLFDADYQIERTLSWRPWIRDSSTGNIVGGWK